jgi:hypothetical protein
VIDGIHIANCICKGIPIAEIAVMVFDTGQREAKFLTAMIKYAHRMPYPQQFIHHMGADETASSNDQDFHADVSYLRPKEYLIV